MKQTALGTQGLTTSAPGLGCMGMSAFYGGATESGSIATIRRALELGVTMFDTAEAYGPFINEQLLGRVLGNERDHVTVATKFAIEFEDDAPPGPKGSPAYAHRALDRSWRHLGTDHIDLWYLHRVDPGTPIEETIGAMGEAVASGKVRYIGVSETSAGTLRRAHATFPITAIQSEYRLFERDAEHNGVLDTARELGIGFVPFSPLGRGFLGGTLTRKDDLPDGDARRNLPRFADDAIGANLASVAALRTLAARKDITPAQLALAWVIQARHRPPSRARRNRVGSRRTPPLPMSNSPQTTSSKSSPHRPTEPRRALATLRPECHATAANKHCTPG